MTKPHVVVLSQQPGVGGAERVVLMALARSERLRVTVVAPEVQCSFAGGLGLEAISLDLPRIRTPFFGPLRLAQHSARVALLCRKLGARVLYANAIRAMGYGLAVKTLGGPPLVAHNHHLLRSTDQTLIEGGMLDRRRLVWALERWADAVIVPSEAAASAFRSRSKVRLLPNGIDLSHFQPPPDKPAAKRSLGLDPDAVVVGTVTRADPEKGMNAFLEVAERLLPKLSKLQFLLGGGVSFPHEAGPYRGIQHRAGRHPGRIHMTGALDDPLAAFQAMDLMLHLTGLPESFGLTVVEAMACGVPVVGYEWGGVAEILGKGRGGVLVPPRDLDRLVEAVERLTAHATRRREMGTAGRRLCEESFGIERFMEGLEDVLIAAAR